MLETLRQRLRKVRTGLYRLWRLSVNQTCGYRLRTDGVTRSIERVVDTQVIGDHLYITDIDGLTYIVALAHVRSLLPIQYASEHRMLNPVQVVG